MAKQQIAVSTDAIVSIFNKMFPVGSPVEWRSIKGGPLRTYTVAAKARNQNGQAVAWFKERLGMVSIDPMFVNYEVE